MTATERAIIMAKKIEVMDAQIQMLNRQAAAAPVARPPIEEEVDEGTPKEEILRIWKGKFSPENLIRLRQDAVQFDTEREFVPGETSLRVRLSRGKVSDFKTVAMWDEGFSTYLAILLYLFPGDAAPVDLFPTMLAWQMEIKALAMSYDWQGGAADLAISFHRSAMDAGHLRPEAWRMTERWVKKWCNHSTERSAPATPTLPRKRTATNAFPTTLSTSDFCRTFNGGGTCRSPCVRPHRCSRCEKPGHRATTCTLVLNKV